MPAPTGHTVSLWPARDRAGPCPPPTPPAEGSEQALSRGVAEMMLRGAHGVLQGVAARSDMGSDLPCRSQGIGRWGGRQDPDSWMARGNRRRLWSWGAPPARHTLLKEEDRRRAILSRAKHNLTSF